MLSNMKPGQTSIRDGIQNILFPMCYMNITQGNDGVYSHQGVYALDLAGSDGGRDAFYAPFDVVCKAIDTPKNGNAVWWESQNKVRFADGTIDYATIMVIHDNSIAGIFVGAKYSQGTQIAVEGTAGNATGNHLHFEIAKGKYQKMYHQNQYGVYHLPGSVNAANCCFVDDTTIINDNGMNWKHLPSSKIGYQVHMYDIGWGPMVYDGAQAGTTGQSRRVEAIRIDPLGYNITAKAHIQDIGWKNYGKINVGTVIGTTGQSLRLEAICLDCTNVRLEYRVHIAKEGWSAWTKADGNATLGTVGMQKAIEAIQIRIIE